MTQPPEPDSEHHAERRVVYETVSSTSTRSSAITIGIVVVIAIALIVWIVLQMR
jgi:hypothetical protein